MMLDEDQLMAWIARDEAGCLAWARANNIDPNNVSIGHGMTVDQGLIAYAEIQRNAEGRMVLDATRDAVLVEWRAVPLLVPLPDGVHVV